MGKSSNQLVIEQEFTKLHAQLHQSVHVSMIYLDALKHNLGKYDHKHHLHHSKSATSFFSDGLDHAKDAVKGLKHVADHFFKDAGAAEATAARSAMEQAFNALADLHKVANAYDSEHLMSGRPSGKKPTTSETMEWLVSSTRDAKFTGFAPLQRQINEAQNAIAEIAKPSVKSRAKDAMHNMTNRLDKMRGDHTPNPHNV